MSRSRTIGRESAMGRLKGSLQAKSTTVAMWPYAVVLLALSGLLICSVFRAYDLSVVLTLVAIVALATADLRGLFVLAFPAATLVGAVWSVSLIEAGAFVTEQYRYGFNIGATPLLSIYVVAFLATGHAILNVAIPRVLPSSRQLNERTLAWCVALGSLALGLFYAFVFVRYGVGLKFESRFDWLNTLPGFVQQVHGLLASFATPMVFCLGAIHLVAFGFTRRSLLLLTLAIPAVAIFATGEKFSGFQNMILLFLTGLGLGGYLVGRRLQIKLGYLIGALVVSAGLAIVLALGYSRMGVDDPLQSIRDRFALQGHVWFGIADSFGGNARLQVSELIAPNLHNSPAGLDLLSYFVAPPDYVYGRIGRGVSFTMGGPPSALAAFGDVGGIFVFAMLSTAYVAVILVALAALSRNHIVLGALALMYYSIVGYCVIMGRWDTAYGTVSLAIIAASAVLFVGIRAGLPTRLAKRLERFTSS